MAMLQVFFAVINLRFLPHGGVSTGRVCDHPVSPSSFYIVRSFGSNKVTTDELYPIEVLLKPCQLLQSKLFIYNFMAQLLITNSSCDSQETGNLFPGTFQFDHSSLVIRNNESFKKTVTVIFEKLNICYLFWNKTRRIGYAGTKFQSSYFNINLFNCHPFPKFQSISINFNSFQLASIYFN